MKPVIESSQLTKLFDRQVAVQSVDFRVNEGSIHAVIGPNGSGKSTLLRLISGVIQPTRGSIRYFGDSVENGATLRQRVHYISPEVNLYPFFRIRDILKYASLLYPLWNAERSERLLDAFDLPRNKTIRHLSLGMKMRLRLVLALSAQADVLLLDEATNGIDPSAKDQVLDLLLQACANDHVTVVMATHQLAEIERVADTVTTLVDGTLIATNSIDELKETVYEVYTALSADHTRTLQQTPGVLNYEDDGIRQQFIWMGQAAGIQAHLREMDCTTFDIHPATLERWFQSIVQKEGAKRGKIVLPKRVAL